MASLDEFPWFAKTPILDDRHARALINGVTKEMDVFLKSYKRAKVANDAGYFNAANVDRKRAIVACGRLVELRPKFGVKNQLSFDACVEKTETALEKYPPFPLPLNNNAAAIDNFCSRLQRRSTSVASVPEAGTPAEDTRSVVSEASTRQDQRLRLSFKYLRAAGEGRSTHGSSRGSTGSTAFSTCAESDDVAEIDDTLRAVSTPPNVEGGDKRKTTSGKNTSETLPKHPTNQLREADDERGVSIVVPANARLMAPAVDVIGDAALGVSMAPAVDTLGGGGTNPLLSTPSMALAVDGAILVSSALSASRADGGGNKCPTSKTSRQISGSKKTKQTAGVPKEGIPAIPKPDGGVEGTNVADRAASLPAGPEVQCGGQTAAAAARKQTAAIQQRQEEIQAGKENLGSACKVFASFLTAESRQLDDETRKLQTLIEDVNEGVVPEVNELDRILSEHENEQADSIRAWAAQNPVPARALSCPPSPPLSQPQPSSPPCFLRPTAPPFLPQPQVSTPHPTLQVETGASYANKATRHPSPVVTAPQAAAAATGSNRRGGSFFAPPNGASDTVYYTPSVRDGDDIYGSSVGQSMLRLQVANTAKEFLVSNRPKGNERFTGDGGGVDFENTLSRFLLVTSQEGVTDLHRFMELRSYFAGSAGTVCELYERNQDPAVGLRETITHLKKNFGRRNVSAQRMLDDVLQGKQIEKSDARGMQTFVLKLETTYQRAVETNRQSTFNSQDTINQIIRKKLRCVAVRWGVTRTKKRLKWTDDDSDETEPTFVEFLNYLKEQYLVSLDVDTILGKPEATAKAPESKKKGEKPPVTANINAASASTGQPAKTANTTSPTGAKRGAPGGRGRGRGAGRGGGRGGVQVGGRGSSPFQPPASTSTSKAPAPKTMGGPATQGNTWICVSCEGTTYHQLDVCPNFSTRPSNERFSLLRAAGKCLVCLGKGHIGANCPSKIRCKCGGKHHPCMCHGDAPARGATDGGDKK